MFSRVADQGHRMSCPAYSAVRSETFLPRGFALVSEIGVSGVEESGLSLESCQEISSLKGVAEGPS